jgi:hypothetical protein
MYIFMYKKTSILFHLVSIHPERRVMHKVNYQYIDGIHWRFDD